MRLPGTPRLATGRDCRAGGFTLVEVLVALAVMAVLAGVAWRGVDAMVSSRSASQASLDRTLRLGTALAQWEQDLQAVRPTGAVPGLRFDGSSLRMTREVPGGVQLVAWTLREGAWWRWAGPVVTQTSALQEQWMASQQLLGDEPGTLQVLPEVSDWQVYFFRGDAWTNAQSAGDPATAAGASRAAPGAPAGSDERVPEGVRAVLTTRGASLTRDLVMAPQMP